MGVASPGVKGGDAWRHGEVTRRHGSERLASKALTPDVIARFSWRYKRGPRRQWGGHPASKEAMLGVNDRMPGFTSRVSNLPEFIEGRHGRRYWSTLSLAKGLLYAPRGIGSL